MDSRERTVEQELARIAGRSHGVVTRAELLRAGITAEEIRGRLGTGALLREHPGVYRVGHRAPSVRARYLAAVRASGRDALLSGVAAGHILGLVSGAAPAPQVTAPTRRRIDGVRTVRSRHIDRRDAMTWHEIPVTTVARTVVDLAAAFDLDRLARVCHEAGLPLPETNRPAGGRRVDCRWPAHRLTVELDSYRFHHSRHAWEQDRRREREARARGDEFRRYTRGDVFERPALMLAELRGPGRRLKRAALVVQDNTQVTRSS